MKNQLVDLLTSLACKTLDPQSLNELSYRLHDIAQSAMSFNGSDNRGRYERSGRQPPHPQHHHHSHQHQQQSGRGWRGYRGAEGGSAGYDQAPRPSFHGRGGGTRRGGRGHQDEKPFDRHSNQENDAKPTEHRDSSVEEDNRPTENGNNNPRERGFRARNNHRPRRN